MERWGVGMTSWVVVAEGSKPHLGWLFSGSLRVPVSLGRNGISHHKQEGDGNTPAGSFRLLRLLWRADRMDKPVTGLPTLAILPNQGWCDDPASPHYNRPVQLPFGSSAECLWRKDGLYDLVVVLNHNTDTTIPGAGSAIFIHIRRDDNGPTEGCVGVSKHDLEQLLASATPETEIVLHA